MTDKKKIVLAGRCDHDNYGDSLMFSFYVKALQSSYSVYLLNASSEFLARIREDGLHADNMPLEQLKSDPSVKGVMFVGGGYFGEPEIGKAKWSASFTSGYFPKVAAMLEQASVPYVIQGVEAGPISSQEVRTHIRTIMGNAGQVIVRNNASLEFCREIGVDSPRFLPDVVLAGAKDFHSSQNFDQANTVEGEFDIAIHATGRLFSANLLARMNLAALVREIRKKKLSRVAIFFDQMENQTKFLPAATALAERLAGMGLGGEVFNYNGHAQLLNLIKRSRLVITTKLHAGMTAVSFGNKVMSISSAPKIKRFYQEAGLSAYHCGYFLTLPGKKARVLSEIIRHEPLSVPAELINGSRQNLTEVEEIEWKRYS